MAPGEWGWRVSWICPHCGSSHDTTACPTLFRTYSTTPEPDAEAKLAAVERLLLEWADAPSGSMGELLDLVEAVRRVVAS